MQEELKQEVERLKRRAARERAARKQAEQLLEQKSLELYEANQAMQRSHEELEDRVTERTRELVDARIAAESANKAKSVFLSNMSHEMRTPLHAILSFAGFGMKRAETAERSKLYEYFQTIDVSGHRLFGLVENLLDLAILDDGEMEFNFLNQDLGELIAHSVDEFASFLSQRSVRVVFDRPEQPIMAEVDTQRMLQALRNVVDNAIRCSDAEANIEITLLHEDEQAIIEIRDHGIGIPEDELESVFEKFVQSSRTQTGAGGTGLGLSIAREILEAHRGTLKAVNVHPGALLVMKLPVKQLEKKDDYEGNRCNENSQQGDRKLKESV